MLACLAEHGLTAFVTLHHFTLPRWFAERGGWLAPDALERFERYGERVAAALGDLMPYACTVNEPQIVALFGYREGIFPPGVQHAGQWRRAGRVLLEAHRAAVRALGAGRGSPKAGVCLQLPALEPARPRGSRRAWRPTRRCGPRCTTSTSTASRAPSAATSWACSTTARMRVDPAVPGGFGPPPAEAPLTLMGWELHPDGLHAALRDAARVGLPVIVTENGIATADDEDRVAYLESHLGALKRALDEGIDVRGYIHWSSWDNFEWAEGYRPTFGLVGIDREDGLRRVVRPSAEAFGRVARSGELAALR